MRLSRERRDSRIVAGMHRVRLASLLVLSSLACAEKETPISELVDAAVVEGNMQIDVFCDCFAEFGYASASECESDLGFIGPSQQNCVVEAYEQDEASARSYLECVQPLQENYTACINERLVCSDPTTVDVCNTDFEVGIDNCITLPESINRDLEACFQ
jgi:hypothetical protein